MNFIEDNKIVKLLAKKMAGEISPEEQLVLEVWIAKSPINKELYDDAVGSKLLRDYKYDAVGVDMTTELDKYHKAINRRSRKSILQWISVAAAAVIVIGVFMLLRGNDSEPIPTYLPGSYMALITVGDGEPVHLVGDKNESAWRKIVEQSNIEDSDIRATNIVVDVPRGGEYKIRLEDGTMIMLNSESRLYYPNKFVGDKREVKLVGEGYFEVTKDTEKPFVVNAGNSQVTVLGTSFNLNAYPVDNEITTTLVSGLVVVDVSDESVELTPGKQIVVDISTGKITIKDVNTELYTSWREGFFEFDGLSLKDICTRLSRWYDVDFIFIGESGEERFTGAARKYEQLENFLTNIERVTNVSFSYNDNNIVVSLRE